MCEEVFVVSGAIEYLVDSRYPFIDVVSVCSLWPCLMDDRGPQSRSWLRSVMWAQKPSVRFETMSSAVVFSRRPFLRWSIEFLFSRLASFICPRLFVLRIGRLTGEASSNRQWSDPLQVEDIALSYAFLRGDLEERDVFQDGLRKADVPEVEVEGDGVIATRYFEIFAISRFRKPRYDVRPVYLRIVRHGRPFLRKQLSPGDLNQRSYRG